jgi:hypothetical protein
MPSPVKPSQFSALVPSPDEPLWSVIVKFFQSMFLWYQFKAYAMDESGVPTDIWVEELCEGVCKARSTTERPLTYSDCGCHDSEGRVV